MGFDNKSKYGAKARAGVAIARFRTKLLLFM
jgi:hypothetical protein